MPIYEYTCPACDHLFEELVRSEREARQVACPKCGQRQVQRRLSVFAAHAAAPKPSRSPRCDGCPSAGAGCPLGER